MMRVRRERRKGRPLIGPLAVTSALSQCLGRPLDGVGRRKGAGLFAWLRAHAPVAALQSSGDRRRRRSCSARSAVVARSFTVVLSSATHRLVVVFLFQPPLHHGHLRPCACVRACFY